MPLFPRAVLYDDSIMRSVRLLRNENVIRVFRQLWDSSRSQKFALVTKKTETVEPDPYEGNFSFTECDQYTKVTVIGAAGRVGRTLSLLLKTCPLIDHLCLFDTDKSVKGVGVDISHIDTKCCVSYVCGMRNIQQALEAPDVVVIAAGCPTSPNLNGKKLFDKNAPIVAGLSEACARFCPKACIVLITSPINSLLPVMGEVYQLITNRIPSRKLFGLTTLDVVRANTFVAEVVRKDPNNVIVPVIGGTSQETIVPVISQMKPCCKIKRGEMIALTECLKRAEGNLADCQHCGTRGSSSLSTAYAAFRFTSSLVMALKGAEDIVECAFVKSDVIPELEYLASPLKLGSHGVEYNFGYPPLSDREKDLGTVKETGPDDEEIDDPTGDSTLNKFQHSLFYRLSNPEKNWHGNSSLWPKRRTTTSNSRWYHTVHHTSIGRSEQQSQRNRLQKYLQEDRRRALVPVKTINLPKLANDVLKYKAQTTEGNFKKNPWNAKFQNAYYKHLNATAKQKYRAFNVRRKFTPSASVVLLLSKMKKERAAKNSLLNLPSEKKTNEKSMVKKEKEQEQEKEGEEDEEQEQDQEKTQLVVTKKDEKDESRKYKDFVLQQLQELRKENEELKKKLLQIVENKQVGTALQVRSDNLELERTRLKACWLIMSSTMDAFSNFCRKLTSKTDPKLIRAVKAEEEEEEEEEDDVEETEGEDRYEDALDDESKMKDMKFGEKYYQFLEKLMEDQIESKKSRKRV